MSLQTLWLLNVPLLVVALLVRYYAPGPGAFLAILGAALIGPLANGFLFFKACLRRQYQLAGCYLVVSPGLWALLHALHAQNRHWKIGG